MTRDVEPRFKVPRAKRVYRGLARRSAKRAAEERVLADAKRTVRARAHGWCEVPGCTRRGAEVHHIVPRSGGKPIHTPDVLVLLCDDHHDQAHADPQWARDMNLKRRRAPDELEPRED